MTPTRRVSDVYVGYGNACDRFAPWHISPLFQHPGKGTEEIINHYWSILLLYYILHYLLLHFIYYNLRKLFYILRKYYILCNYAIYSSNAICFWTLNFIYMYRDILSSAFWLRLAEISDSNHQIKFSSVIKNSMGISKQSCLYHGLCIIYHYDAALMLHAIPDKITYPLDTSYHAYPTFNLRS